ncbi:SRPBCC family protein [Streptomyces violaceorubidus]|uniref:SRPBCC family protein n=1 Tax=Streptomyces violaceorubidus TaxID=284042 RepID=UPI0004C00896|nr:SRPBCC family protein [Streptomyces violaceorubidus]
MHGASDSHPDIHWPSGYSPDHAHSFCQAQVVVHAPPATAFGLLTDVARWPQWAAGVTESRPGALEGTFRVRFHEQAFEVFLGERAEPHRLGWSVVGAGVQVYQAWLLTEVAGGTHVVSENVVRGPAARALDVRSPQWARRLHALWLAQLKRLSESTAG